MKEGEKMISEPKLTVMLTYNDLTVMNAGEIFEMCRDTDAEFWGMKEEPLGKAEMKKLFAVMKECGKKTFLEVVCYDEKESLAGAKLAAECGCDYLMGTVFCDSVNDYCKEHGLKYLPFVGKVSERPSVLEGNIDELIAEAREYVSKGAYGVDLLAYRYTGDASELIERLVNELDAPVCVAGSVDDFVRLDEIKRISPWAFTIGSAFFDKKFGESIPEQINAVCSYMKNTNLTA
ncbi:MAG: hypothetical protein MJ100_09160 [Ruminococcus sp.]|nr:hypothetical protein [Ruminococcus sp.]